MKLKLSSRVVGISLYILLPAMAICAIVELALKNTAPRKPDNWPISGTDKYWPSKVFPGEQNLPNASAAVALVLSIVFFPFVVHSMRRGPVGTKTVRNIVLAILGLNLFLALATFLYSFITAGLSARFDEGYFEDQLRSGKFAYDKGRFTAEAWTCSIVDDAKDAGVREFGWYGRACNLHNAARWMSFVVFLLAGAVFGIVYGDTRQEGNILSSV